MFRQLESYNIHNCQFLREKKLATTIRNETYRTHVPLAQRLRQFSKIVPSKKIVNYTCYPTLLCSALGLNFKPPSMHFLRKEKRCRKGFSIGDTILLPVTMSICYVYSSTQSSLLYEVHHSVHFQSFLCSIMLVSVYFFLNTTLGITLSQTYILCLKIHSILHFWHEKVSKLDFQGDSISTDQGELNFTCSKVSFVKYILGTKIGFITRCAIRQHSNSFPKLGT